jgi:heme/copper-type cytochrome/quinol oxidase subunit 1
LIGFNGTFFVLHFAGMEGMPRRVWTYPPIADLPTLNMISSLFSYILATSIVLFVINLIYSFVRGKPAGDNPWNAWTLEWATGSPPPPENFQLVPVVKSRRPLWDKHHPDDPDWKRE